MTVNRKTLVDRLQQELGFTSSQADFLVRDFFDIISEALVSGEDVKLSGFGNFMLRDKKARPGRNVTANEAVTIAPRRVVTFKAGTKAKNLVKENNSKLLTHFGI